MNSELWARVTALFQEACACPPAERERWLANHCHDAAVRGEVEAMLRAYDTNPEFMEQSVPEIRHEVEPLLVAHELSGTGFPRVPASNTGLGAEVLNAGRPERVGRRIGAYDLVAELGRGGMGEVFAGRSRRRPATDQQVALKLVRAGYATAGIVERFRAERQILAGLDHPNIARLVDGGATDDGPPYLVMELVDGVPIDDSATPAASRCRERLRLFLQVCAAVQLRAPAPGDSPRHQAGQHPGHRDGIPKLLDFGIAKLLDPAGTAEETSLRPFTPGVRQPRAGARRAGVDRHRRLFARRGALSTAHRRVRPYRLESRRTGATGRGHYRPGAGTTEHRGARAAGIRLPETPHPGCSDSCAATSTSSC